MTNAGLIEVQGSRVTILDKRHLSELADQCATDETTLVSTFYHTRNLGNA